MTGSFGITLSARMTGKIGPTKTGSNRATIYVNNGVVTGINNGSVDTDGSSSGEYTHSYSWLTA